MIEETDITNESASSESEEIYIPAAPEETNATELHEMALSKLTLAFSDDERAKLDALEARDREGTNALIYEDNESKAVQQWNAVEAEKKLIYQAIAARLALEAKRLYDELPEGSLEEQEMFGCCEFLLTVAESGFDNDEEFKTFDEIVTLANAFRRY